MPREVFRSKTWKESFARRRRLRKIGGVAAFVLLLCGVKVVFHAAGFERIQINQLFSALVASTVFLLGFLLSGVLTDFKESEKIPGEISTALESLFLEVRGVLAYNPEAHIDHTLVSIVGLGDGVLAWLHGKIEYDLLLQNYWLTHADVSEAARQFIADASALRSRFLQDMVVILQKVNRVHTIRETSFVPLVYWMADAASILLITGLIFAKSENLAESVFFVGVISFLVILLIRLIKDIDNPFGWSDPHSAEDVSIDLLSDTIERLRSALPSGSI